MRKFIRKNRIRVVAAVLAAGMILSTTGCGIKKGFKYGFTLDNLRYMAEDKDDLTELDGDGSAFYTGDDTYGDYTYADTENEEFEAFLNDEFKDYVTSDSLTYHYSIKDGANFGIEAPKATIGDAGYGQEKAAEEKKELEEDYEKLLTFEDAELTEEERFIYKCLVNDTNIAFHKYDNIYFYEPFSPLRGQDANLPTNFTDYKFYNKEDVETYLTVLGGVRGYFAKFLEYEYEKSEAGYFMSDAVADKVIEHCDEFVSDKSDNHYMIVLFNSSIDALNFLSDEEKADAKERNKKLVLDVVIPAYQDVRDTISSLKGTGTNDLGLCYYDGGKDYYANYIFPLYSGSGKTVDEEIAIMESRLSNKQLELQMLAFTDKEGYTAYVEDYNNIFSKYDAMDATEMIDYHMANNMDEFPEMGEIKYKADYMEPAEQVIMDNTLAYYMAPPLDDPEANIISVNGAHTNGMWLTLAHEGCPGHMFQHSYLRASGAKPFVEIQSNLGYVEGWAVYSSYLTYKNCDFDGSKYAKTWQQIAQINDDLGYLLYGRIDIGVNYEGWKVEDVQAFMAKQGYSSDYADDIMTTVIGDPGAYLSYTTGYYEMEELRKRAEDSLGDKFDPKTYHDAILRVGACQFNMLSHIVDKYIEENK